MKLKIILFAVMVLMLLKIYQLNARVDHLNRDQNTAEYNMEILQQEFNEMMDNSIRIELPKGATKLYQEI